MAFTSEVQHVAGFDQWNMLLPGGNCDNCDEICHVPSAALILEAHVELEPPEPGSLSDCDKQSPLTTRDIHEKLW